MSIGIFGLNQQGSSLPSFAQIPNSVATTVTPYLSTPLSSGITPTATLQNSSDTRVILKAQTDDVYGTGIMNPLKTTGGLLFPYTPTITQNHRADYATMSMVHSNSDFLSYTKTPNVQLQLTAKFTFQNQREGKYMLAALHFLRTCSKMYFGKQDQASGKAGLPPPVLLFSAYGSYMYNQVRVLLIDSSWSFDEHMDMLDLTTDDGTKVKLPPMLTLQLSLTVQNTAKQMKDEFTLDGYRSGALLKSGGWL